VAAQSSPDVASDDADSKESGYITLEDLQAQLGLSSWSSDERQTDLDAGSSSGDELRAPDGLRGGAGVQSTSSALAGSSAAVLLPPPAPPSSSSFLSRLMRPEQFAAFDGGGAVDCCRSAPPTCDASLLRFTFTVRLDSKMFHRRAAAAAANRGRDPPPVTDGQERGERRETVVGRDRELCKPAAAVPDAATGGGSDDPSAPGAAVEKLASPAPAAVYEHSSSPTESAPSSGQQNAAVSASPPPPDCAGSASKTAQQQQQQQQAFAGEKVVVTAEVHRSADQIDTDRPHHNNNNSNNNNNNNNNKTLRSLGAAAASCCPRPKTKSFGAKEAARRTASRPRAPSPPCQPDDVIVSCSPEAELVDRCSGSIQHDQVVDAGFNGRLSYVDVDRVMSFGRQRSSTSSAQRNSSIRKLSDGLTLTLRRPLKLRNSAAATADPRTLPRKKPSDSETAGRWCLQRTVDGAAASTSEARSAAAAAAADRHASRERRAPARVFSESSSVSSADSDPEICGPCVARDASAACGRGCPPRSGRRRAGKPLPGILGGSGGGGDDDGGAGPASTKSAAAATRSQSTRRALRQFFRVDNLFACRHGGRPGGSADRPAEGTSRASGEPQDAGRGGCEAATTQRGRRSETPAALARTCRRSSRVGGQSRTRRGADVACAGAASRSVSPHARSRDARPTYPAAAPTRPAGTCRGSGGGDRHRSRDRCRHAAAQVDDAAAASASVANSSHVGGGHQRWNTLCLSPSDNSILTPESGCGFSGRRRVLATTPISPSTPAPDSLPHAVTLGECFSSLHRSRMRIL